MYAEAKKYATRKWILGQIGCQNRCYIWGIFASKLTVTFLIVPKSDQVPPRPEVKGMIATNEIFKLETVNCVIVASDEELGQILSVKVWNPSSGIRWFLQRISVQDLMTGDCWMFVCGKEIAGRRRHVFSAHCGEFKNSVLFRIKFVNYFRDWHLWYSLLAMRPWQSEVMTRCQRLAATLVNLLLIMMTSSIYYSFATKEGVVKMPQSPFFIGLLSSLGCLPIMLMVRYLLLKKIWIYSKRGNEKVSGSSDYYYSGLPDESSAFTGWDGDLFEVLQAEVERKNKKRIKNLAASLKRPYRGKKKSASKSSSSTTCYETAELNSIQKNEDDTSKSSNPDQEFPSTECRAIALGKNEMSYETYETAWTSPTGENTWTIVHVSSSHAGETTDLSSFSLHVVETTAPTVGITQPSVSNATLSHALDTHSTITTTEAQSQYLKKFPGTFTTSLKSDPIPPQKTLETSISPSYLVAVESSAVFQSPTISQPGADLRLTANDKDSALVKNSIPKKEFNSIAAQTTLTEPLTTVEMVNVGISQTLSSEHRNENISEIENFKTLDLSQRSSQCVQKNLVEEDGTQTTALEILQETHSAQTSFKITPANASKCNVSLQTSNIAGLIPGEPHKIDSSLAGMQSVKKSLELRQQAVLNEIKSLHEESLLRVFSLDNPADANSTKKNNVNHSAAELSPTLPNVQLCSENNNSCAERVPLFENLQQKISDKPTLARSHHSNVIGSDISKTSQPLLEGTLTQEQRLEPNYRSSHSFHLENIAVDPTVALGEVQYKIASDNSIPVMNIQDQPYPHIAHMETSSFPMNSTITHMDSKEKTHNLIPNLSPQELMRISHNLPPAEELSEAPSVMSADVTKQPLSSNLPSTTQPLSTSTNQTDQDYHIFPGALAALKPCICNVERQKRIFSEPYPTTSPRNISNDDFGRERDSHLQKKNVSFMKINRRQQNRSSDTHQGSTEVNPSFYEFKHTHWENKDQYVGLSVKQQKNRKVTIGRLRIPDMISLSAGVPHEEESSVNSCAGMYRMPNTVKAGETNNLYALACYDQEDSITECSEKLSPAHCRPKPKEEFINKNCSFVSNAEVRQAQPQVSIPDLKKKRKRDKKNLKKRICEEFINKLQIHEAGETYCRPEVELRGRKVHLDASYLSEDKLSMTSSDIVKYWVKNSPILPNYYSSRRLRESPSTSTEVVRSAVSKISLQSGEEPPSFDHSNSDSVIMYPSAGINQKEKSRLRMEKQKTKPRGFIARSFMVNVQNRSATFKRFSVMLVSLTSVLALVVGCLLGSSFDLWESLRWATAVVVGYFASMIVSETLMVFGAALLSFYTGSALDDADWFPPISTLDNYHYDSKREEKSSKTQNANLKISDIFSKCKKTLSSSNV